MTISAAARTTANASTEGILDVEVSPVIWHVGEPTDCPLISLTGGKLYKTGQDKPEDVPAKIKREASKEIDYKVIEKDPLARTCTTNGAVADTTTTTIAMVATTNLTVGDTLRNKATGEVVYVYAISSPNVSARRNLGSTAFTIGASDVWVVVGYAAKQGGSKRTLKSQLASPRSRYNQIFKRSWGVTGTMQKVQLVVNNSAWDEEQTQALENHKKDIEFSFWFNPAADSTTDTDGTTVYLTRGLLAELGTSRTIDCAGNLDEDRFFGEISESIFQYGPSRKQFLADGRLRSLINSWSRVKQQTAPYESKYGLTVKEIDTGHGILEMMSAGVFGKFFDDADKGYGCVLDLSRLSYRYIDGRDTKLDPDTRTPGDDVEEAQYITECGLQVKSLDHHKIITIGKAA
jgi:hypothetical protein